MTPMLHPKRIGTLKGSDGDEVKQTSEIGMVIPLLEVCDITDRDIAADTLHTQRELARLDLIEALRAE